MTTSNGEASKPTAEMHGAEEKKVALARKYERVRISHI